VGLAPRRYLLRTVIGVIRWRSGRVVAVGRRWSTALELDVVIGPSGSPDGRTVRALAYTDVVGEPRVGEEVLLNVTALDLDLGTGGYALVSAIPGRLPDDSDGPGHVVKARYTPLQMTVLGVDEQDSPHHDVLRDADDLADMPVVTADLHSSLPAVVAGVRQARPDAVVVYVATDGGALPLAFSQAVEGLSAAGWLSASITVGQAFGGDFEAVTVHNGLLAARLVAGADVAVVAQGPGNLGTGTRWGFSGIATGEAVNAAGVLEGRPVGALRVSSADARERHHGVSHHSLTAYGKVAMQRADIVVPLLDGDFGDLILRQSRQLADRHAVVEVGVDGLDEALDACPVPLRTMGRGPDDDAAAFLAAAAAGRHAASLISR
jgi:hypothetical protein